MKRAQNQPTSSLTIYAGCFVKAYTVADAGTVLPQHSHQHPHLTAVTAGEVEVHSDGGVLGVFVAPAFIKVPALTKHLFITRTPNVGLMCIHALASTDADGVEIADEHTLELED